MQHLNHFSLEINKSISMIAEYDTTLVIMSYLIAIISGYCTFNIINIMKLNTQRSFFFKILAGMILGLGIWSMHFIGMLAFYLPIPIYYDIDITILSVVPAMVSCVCFVHYLDQPYLSKRSILYASSIFTAGVTTMHFVGMLAMSMKANMVHDSVMLLLTVVASLASSIFTVLVLDNRIIHLSEKLRIFLSTVLLGITIANMHYFAMETVYFFPNESLSPKGIANDLLSYGVVAISVIVMIVFTLIINLQNKIVALTELTSEQNKLIKETVDNMQDSFALTNHTGDILMTNKKFIENFIEPGAFLSEVGENINDLYRQLSRDTFLSTKSEVSDICLNLSTSEQKDSYKIETNNNEFWLLRRHRTASNNIIHTWTDITDQTRQEEELVLAKNEAYDTLSQLEETQNELLETKKMASLGRLVSGVAHELNTPIGVSITALSKIRESTEGTLSELQSGTMKKSALEKYFDKTAGLTGITIKNLDRAAELIQKFKYISVAEETDGIKSFNLHQSLENMLPLWRKNHNIQIEIHLSNDIAMCTYESVLLQVLSNFVTNTVEHAFQDEGRGLINISAQVIENSLKLEYEDNGCGIDQTIVENIFEPFVTTKRNEGKIGLGIHISYNLVYQKLQGTLKMKQRSEKQGTPGTVFIINIPLRLPEN